MNTQAKKKSIRFCPFDGSLLSQTMFCLKCNQQISIQNKRPRKPRNFYEKMPEGIEDNYVDDYFLKGLVHKNSFPDLRYPSMIRETLEIIHVINTLTAFIVSFVLLLNNDYEVETFFIVTISSLLFYGMFIWIYKAKYTVSGMINDIKTAVFLASTLLFLTPVLKSLTVAYSTDTIIILNQIYLWNLLIILDNSLVVFFILLHLFLYDYQMIKKPLQLENITQSIGSPTSLNAIFFATILLASRLQKMRQVYVLLFESIILFGFFPLFRQGLRSYSILVSDILSVILYNINCKFNLFQLQHRQQTSQSQSNFLACLLSAMLHLSYL